MKARQTPPIEGPRRQKWDEKVSRYMNNKNLTFYVADVATVGVGIEQLYEFPLPENPFTTYGDMILFHVVALFSGVGVGARNFYFSMGATFGGATTLGSVSATGPDLITADNRLTYVGLSGSSVAINYELNVQTSSATAPLLSDRGTSLHSQTFPQKLYLSMQAAVGNGYLDLLRIDFFNGHID